VIEIRKKKLPDPDEVANNGSFFANPIIDQDTFNDLQKQFPDIVSWPAKQDKVKLSAGWLIEHAGFKDFHDKETGMATWDKQSLVLINEHAESTADVLAFKQKIVDGVNKKFGINLEQEPELI
jgi:UDP-N-acetylmuramate dehydrogenase